MRCLGGDAQAAENIQPAAPGHSLEAGNYPLGRAPGSNKVVANPSPAGHAARRQRPDGASLPAAAATSTSTVTVSRLAPHPSRPVLTCVRFHGGNSPRPWRCKRWRTFLGCRFFPLDDRRRTTTSRRAPGEPGARMPTRAAGHPGRTLRLDSFPPCRNLAACEWNRSA
jgi:hypothetical protein